MQRAVVVTVHLETLDVMTTPFDGPDAAVRAHRFMEGEKARGDFPDYEWTVLANDSARDRLADYRMGTLS